MKDLNPEQVRRFIEAAYSRDVTPRECEDAMIALNKHEAEVAAQGKALAAAQRALERINEESTHYDIAAVYLGWIAREALASLSKAQ